MKTNYKFWLGIFILAVGAVISYTLVARATSPADITFPVAELGNCKSETECKAYCDRTENITVCVSFAEKHNLISGEEAEQARKFAQIGAGPGGCTSKDSCETYCNDVTHMDECLAFAEQNGLISQEELREARQVQAALAKGAKLPGNCRNKNECEQYCNDPNNMEECITFGEAAGFIPPEELAQAKKVLEVIKTKGVKPPPCRGQEACDAYCADNFEECIAFAEAAGFVSSEEAVMARKTGGRGPGDCRSKEECESFCNNSANQETCFNFAMEHDLIPPAQLQEMREGMEKLKEGLRMAPPEVLDCLRNTVGTEILDKIQSGALAPGPQIGDQVRACFEQFTPGPPPGEGFGLPPETPVGFDVNSGQFQGPGGCRTLEECRTYCESNPEACRSFGPAEQNIPQPPEGFQPPGLPPGVSPEQYREFEQQFQQQMMPPPNEPTPTGGNLFDVIRQFLER